MVDISSGTVLAEVKTGERPYAVALASGKAFVTNQYEGTLTVFDSDTYKPAGEIEVGEYPEGVAASGDGKFIYVANWFDNTVMKIDAVSNRVIGKVKRGTVQEPSGPLFAKSLKRIVLAGALPNPHMS